MSVPSGVRVSPSSSHGFTHPSSSITMTAARGSELEVRGSMKPPTVFLGEMTTLEVEAFLKTHHTVIVPTGATEQHGPHGPLATDVLIPNEVARRVAPQIGAVVAPPISYALSYP